MKKLIIAAGILVLTGVSCQKKLDVQPAQSIDEKDALKTNSGVLTALNGSYADLGNAALYGGDIFLYNDLLSDAGEIRWNGTYAGLTQIYNKAIPKNNSFVRDTWLQGYKVINDVNNVLSALTVVDASLKDRVEGEAKFIRGSVYFDLVRSFAKSWNDGSPTTNLGVPIVLTPTRPVAWWR